MDTDHEQAGKIGLHAPNINDLPDELLVRIMSHLSLFHRKRLREVCSHWEFISYDRSLIGDDWMVVPSVKDLKKLEDRAPYKKFINLRIKNVKDDPVKMSVWQKFGPFIKNIELFKVSYKRSLVFAYIFKYCNDLKSLLIASRPSVYGRTSLNDERVSIAELMPNEALSTLTSIMLYDHSWTLTNAEFNALTRNSLHLTSIILQGYLLVSIENIRNLLVRQSKKLTHLTLPRIDISKEVLSDLLSCVGSQLTSLELSSLDLLPEEFLLKVCALFPNLEELTFTETKISSDILFSSLKKLKSIVLHDSLLTNVPLHLSNLSISLFGPNDITEDDVITAFTHRPLPNLETLNLRCNCIFDKFVCAISPMIPNVRCLYLSPANISAIGMQAIINYNKALRILSLDGRSLKQLFSHTPSINDLTELRELELHFCPEMDESWIESISLKRLRKLKLEQSFEYWDYCGSPPWPTSCFATLIEACPSLEIIDMPLEAYREDVGLDTKTLSARAKKILPLPCNCNFSQEMHLTQKCQF